MKHSIQLALLVMSFLFISCTGEDQKQEAAPAQLSEARDALYMTSADFKKQMNVALNDYFELKDALVESDAANASAQARELLGSLKDIIDEDLAEEAGSIWEEHRKTLVKDSEHIAGLDDVEEQRETFISLSRALIHIMDAFGPFQDAVYQQTCPMAGDGSASWLSTSEDIENPYFGDKMLNCGEVVRSL